MSIDFRAIINAGTVHTTEADGMHLVAHKSTDIASNIDLGNHRVMRNIKSYCSQDGMGSHIMSGAECLRWLNEINTFQGNLAKLYLEQIMRYYGTPIHYVTVVIEWD